MGSSNCSMNYRNCESSSSYRRGKKNIRKKKVGETQILSGNSSSICECNRKSDRRGSN
jgi:hypothetical protein